MPRDYYEVLGVSKTASDQEIKSSYRKQAIRFHPDKNPGDAEAESSFKEAAEAYSVLSDGEKRQKYDRFGHQATRGGGFDPAAFTDFSDILGDIFGLGDLFGGRRQRRGGPMAGADLRYDLEVSFEDAAFGTEPKLRIPRLEACETCNGTGGREGAQPETCGACRGRGQVAFQQGFFTVTRTCPQCNGEGVMISDPCETCGGRSRVEQERSIQVRIPAGIENGARLRLSGEGEHGMRGGPAGDLYVVIHVREHDSYVRRGADVYSQMSVPYSVAVLGGRLELETLHGTDELEIPPGTSHGEVFRLRGQGVDRIGGRGRGDHLVEVELDVPHPRSLSEEQIELMKQLAATEGLEIREDRGVLERVKDFFQ